MSLGTNTNIITSILKNHEVTIKEVFKNVVTYKSMIDNDIKIPLITNRYN